MIVYVNGDSHAAAAEAVNPHAWAEDDALYWGLGRRPHPDNERASFGCELANLLGAVLQCDAQAGGSNARIMRTTRDWVDLNREHVSDMILIIQWSTWEREEWWHDGEDFQVNASGIDHVPEALQARYREYIASVDWDQCTQQAHDDIWQFHQELCDQRIRHVMFNGNNHFGNILEHRDWGTSYISPYDSTHTYDQILRRHGFRPVSDSSWHFGEDAHCFWAQYLLNYMQSNSLVGQNEISTD
jgi:hypothetical protein